MKAKTCVDWQTYYRPFLDEAPGHALIGHRGPYVGDEQRLTQVSDALSAGKKAFLITAPAGCGKSRFALELARRLPRSWDVRFVRHDEPGALEELPALLNTREVVFVVDDAHDCPALVQALAEATSVSQARLVCLAQPAGRVAVIEALAVHLPRGGIQELDLGRPDPSVLRELIDKLIPQLSPHHRDVIRRVVADSFFAAALLCTSVARKKNLPQTLSAKHLREYAVRQPIAQAVGDLCPPEKALRALAVYAACAPVRMGDAAIRESAAGYSGLALADIEILERRVLDAGIFTSVAGAALRPVPGLVGDLILEETCLDELGRPTASGRDLLRGLFEQRYGALIRNCVEVERLFVAAARVDLVSDLLLERARALSADSRVEALELLTRGAALAVRQPGAIVRLLEALAGKNVFRASPPPRELGQADNLEVRAQLVLTTASEHDPSIVRSAMAYSRGLLACARPDPRSHQFLSDNLSASCQFAMGRPLAHTAAILDVLNGWLAHTDVETARLAASLTRGFLTLEMRSHRWDPAGPTPMGIGLDPGEEICKLRDRAVDLLVRGTRHAAPEVQYAAAESLGQWARGYGGLTEELHRQWAPQLGRELDVLAASVSQLAATTTHFPVLAAIEQQGWRWWTGEIEAFAPGGKRILDACPAAKPYSLWKALHDERLPILPLPLDESADRRQRHERLQAAVEPDAAGAAQVAKELFDELDRLCASTQSWAELFTSVLSSPPRQPLQRRAQLYVTEFVARHSAAAWSFVTEASAVGPLRSVLPPLLAALRERDTARWQEEVQRSSPGTRLFEVELRALCAVGELAPAELALVSKGLQLEDAGAVHLSAQALLNAAPADLGSRLSAVLAVLPARFADERLWELTLDACVRWGRHALSELDGEEAGPELRAISGELLRLLRIYGSSLSWESGPHTQQLAGAVAIFAATVPHTLKSWMRELWSGSLDPAARGDLPLSPARWGQVVELIAASPKATYWQKQFVEWIVEEPELATLGAQGLAQLCGLADPYVVGVASRVAQQPTSAAVDALADLIGFRLSTPQFLDEVLGLLRHFVDAAGGYDLLERELFFAAAGGLAPRSMVAAREVMLQDIEARAQSADLPPRLRETLTRLRQEIQSAVDEGLLRPAD